MDRNFQISLKKVLKHEGGWADHPKDPGGATMKGVTLASFRRYVNPKATKEDLKKITDQQLSTVYRRNYWDAVLGGELPDGLDYAMFDFAVNSGPSRAVKYLQKIVETSQDGRIGPATLRAIEENNVFDLIERLCDARMEFLKKLGTWPTFGKGWTSRVSAVRKDAKNLAAQPTPEKPTEIIVEKEVEKPIVPVAVDKAVKKDTNFWGWFVGLFGAGGAGLSGIMDGDWRMTLTFVGVACVGLLILLVLGPLIVRRVKAIRAEIEA